jgi:AcrR family transcriptional regulator
VCRTQQVMDDTTAQRIMDAAVDCFFDRGFAGTTIREIASGADVPVGRIYEHYPSKHALLLEIVNAGYDGLISQTLAALADAADAPAAQLDAAIWAQSDFHARHARASFVAQTELRSLAADDRERIAAKCARLRDLFSEILVEGVAQGCFAVEDPAAVSRALLSMCAAIASWYDPAGLQTPRRIAQTYCDLAARMTGDVFPDAPDAAYGALDRLAAGAPA